MTSRFSMILIGFFFMIFISCNYNHLKTATAGNGPNGFNKLEGLDYEKARNAVIAPRCLGCHAAVTGNKGGVNLESYSNIRKLLTRVTFRTLEKQDMPPKGSLTMDEFNYLKTWIDQGAPEFALQTNSETTDIQNGVTDWKKIREHVLGPKCVDCHQQPNPLGNFDATSVTEVRNNADLIFSRVIIKQDMPVSPYPALSPAERKVLLFWFDMGMPE